ncbi:hypothetical protein RI543_000531 [Arxiozyma heterogenica]|uniref:Ubiquitin-like modifier-activating enzyme ATG7 n=1 Tax=Arxiozyma heterogenica TaxID=278026 RepID=A0AAN7WK92_9SACH|nr:hypothetical protein RI543_000531 [Kazachstania heterogenica]
MDLSKNNTSRLKYVFPVNSFIDTSFYQRLSDLKLDTLKLSESSIPVKSILHLDNIPKQNSVTPLFLNGQSFDVNSQSNYGANQDTLIEIGGEILNFNKLEQMMTLDKQQYLYEQGMKLWEDCKKNIHKCFKFCLISFADLKKYQYTYWLMIPSFILKGLIITIEKDLLNRQLNDVRDWFCQTVNRDKWVCVMNNSVIKDYDPEENISLNGKIVFIRDTSNIDKIPSSVTKNILTTIKYNNPKIIKLDVYFVRGSDKKSFGYTLKFDDNNTPNFDEFLLNFSGWERTTEGKLLPRQIDLSSLIDPLKIAEQSLDLNLRLMKWRIVPGLNLDIIKDTKVLLLGAGTLGCYVARTLLGWGVRRITLVDNGTVSHSNLVRQPLFEFNDCGKPKAKVAAAALKRIFPLVQAEGINISIPMIGHPITNELREHRELDILNELIKDHDVIYLLTDSRESRWLPTVLSNIESKMVINAALGFDSYLVMRHGIYDNNDKNAKLNGESTRLGCYFCNDIVVPTDSMRLKTLDQMCTVTRPGVALLASSQAVELMVSMLQRDKAQESNKGQCILGEIPHQIRGFLDKFETLKVESPAYTHCSACSHIIVETCRNNVWDFVKNSLNDNEYIERCSGLLEIKQKMESIMEDITWISDDEL